MKTTFLAGAVLGVLLLVSAPAMAQLAPPNEAGVTLSHIHLTVTDLDAHKYFWTIHRPDEGAAGRPVGGLCP